MGIRSKSILRVLRPISVFLVGVLVGGALLSPAGAHVGGTVKHLWTKHIRPKVRNGHYTKATSDKRYFTRSQANERFLRMSDLTNSIRTIDGAGDVGTHVAAAVGADGMPLISYFDMTSEDLKVAHCRDTRCISRTIASIDSSGNVGQYSSLAIGDDGLGLISYFDSTNLDLKVAHCDNTACSSATTATLDSLDIVGTYTSITIGDDGLGLIAYRDASNGGLKVAHCDNVACSSAVTSAVPGGAGFHTSIAIGSDGLGLVSSHDPNTDEAWIAHCDNVACTSSVSVAFSSGGAFSSITIGEDGFPLIAYIGGGDGSVTNLNVARCQLVECVIDPDNALEPRPTVDSIADAHLEGDVSLTIGADGNGLISYRDPNGRLRVAHCEDAACSGADTTVMIDDGDTGDFSSIASGSDGLGIVAYHDAGSSDVKMAHCATLRCVSLFG